jgi:signal transduction histidine kinase
MQQQARSLDVSLTLAIDDAVPQSIVVDPDKIAWTMTALVGNALRFVRRGTRTMPGGTIVVHAAADRATPRMILEVRDDGPGIPDDVLGRLLSRQPGQLHAPGLALKLAQDIAEAHGGLLQIDSRTDADRSGTTVRLTLPGA